jgi:predicted GH43/DUF377 family glycosyl hydrolase
VTNQFHRYSNLRRRVLHPVSVIPSTGFPSVYRQAQDLGGSFTRILNGLPEGSVANFSPSLIKDKDAYLLAWRSQPEPFCFRADMKYFYYKNTPTDVYIGQLIGDDSIFGARKIRSTPHRLSYEDPRLFVAPDGTLQCQFVTSSYATTWDASKHTMVRAPKVCVGDVNEFGEVTNCLYPAIGENLTPDKPEKNWCFFSDNEQLRLLYSTIPLVLKSPGEPDRVIDSSCLTKVTGPHATFNSTAPIKIDDEWLVFFHWKYMAMETAVSRPHLCYHLGAYCLDEKLTRITRMVKEPLFSGSTNDDLITWTDAVGNAISNQPACILPFGCVVDDDELVMSLGINDSFMGIFRTQLFEITTLMDKP